MPWSGTFYERTDLGRTRSWLFRTLIHRPNRRDWKLETSRYTSFKRTDTRAAVGRCPMRDTLRLGRRLKLKMRSARHLTPSSTSRDERERETPRRPSPKVAFSHRLLSNGPRRYEAERERPSILLVMVLRRSRTDSSRTCDDSSKVHERARLVN